MHYIFYVHDLSHRQHLVLGGVDVATSYHVAQRLQNRDSHQVLQAFPSLWLTPFGIPLEVMADADRAFRAWESLEAHSCRCSLLVGQSRKLQLHPQVDAQEDV